MKMTIIIIIITIIIIIIIIIIIARFSKIQIHLKSVKKVSRGSVLNEGVWLVLKP